MSLCYLAKTNRMGYTLGLPHQQVCALKGLKVTPSCTVIFCCLILMCIDNWQIWSEVIFYFLSFVNRLFSDQIIERVRGGLTEIYQSLDFTEGILRMKYYWADTADKILQSEYWDKNEFIKSLLRIGIGIWVCWVEIGWFISPFIIGSCAEWLLTIRVSKVTTEDKIVRWPLLTIFFIGSSSTPTSPLCLSPLSPTSSGAQG